MSTGILQDIGLGWCFLSNKMKHLSGAIFVVIAIQVPQADAQDLVLQDTTITTTTTFSANSITAGPNFTIAGNGDVVLSAETIAMVPQFFVVQGGKLQVISGAPPLNIAVKDLIKADDFILHQNFPNPFNPSTKISFILPKSEYVLLEIYNAVGQKVETLLGRKMNAGPHDVQFDASGLPSGIYFYRIQVGDAPGRSGEFSQVKKMVLLR